MIKIFLWIRATPFFLRLTWLTRILLAVGFLPSGLTKLLGRRFTTLSVESPIGAFFEAMYQTGFYWHFLGGAQVAAAALLLIPRWSHLGAALFLPIIVNIFVITVALDFTGTPVIVGLMLFAALYLCLWDYHRFRGLFSQSPLEPGVRPARARLDPLERLGFRVFAAALLVFFLGGLGMSGSLARPAVIVGVLAGLFTLLRFLTAGRHRGSERVPDEPTSSLAE